MSHTPNEENQGTEKQANGNTPTGDVTRFFWIFGGFLALLIVAVLAVERRPETTKAFMQRVSRGKLQWPSLSTEEVRETHEVLGSVTGVEFRQCRHILQVGDQQGVNIFGYLWGRKVESVTVVAPGIRSFSRYQPLGDTPNVLYRQAPQLLEDFEGDRTFDCVVVLDHACSTSAHVNAIMRYVNAAGLAVIEASHTLASGIGIGCARAVVTKATAAGMHVKTSLTLALADAGKLNDTRHARCSLWVLRRPSFHTCTLQSTTYKPSALELEWVRLSTTAFKNRKHYCSKATQYADAFGLWANTTAAPGAVRGLALGKKVAASADLSRVLSQHVYTYKCGGKTTAITAYLEPLAGSLRHPYSWCRGVNSDKVRYDFLLPASDQEPPSKRTRTFLFDAGARTYAVGVGKHPNGTSLPAQQFLIETYQRLGIHFDRMLLWEPNVTQGDIFQVVPPQLLPQYQYFSFGGSTGDNNTNPLVVIKQLCVPSDFVVLKMDIDRPELEQAWLNQLVNDVELQQLVDEFYYEFNPDEAGWRALASVYKALAALRQAGIRAHGWI